MSCVSKHTKRAHAPTHCSVETERHVLAYCTGSVECGNCSGHVPVCVRSMSLVTIHSPILQSTPPCYNPLPHVAIHSPCCNPLPMLQSTPLCCKLQSTPPCCNPLPNAAIHSPFLVLHSTPPPPPHTHFALTSNPVHSPMTVSAATSTALLRCTGRSRGWTCSHLSYS